MNSFGLKDYRASHFLLRCLRSNLQAWYARDNILIKSNHPAGNQKDLTTIAKLIETIVCWLNEIHPDTTPFILNDGTILKPERKERITNILFNLSKQYTVMNQRLNKLLDDPTPLSSRRQDFQYIVACMGWVYYEIHYSLHTDLEFIERFNDNELREARKGQEEASQKEIDFVNYLFNTFHLDETYNENTCHDLITMIESIMDTELRNSIQQIDNYIKILKK